MTYRVVHRFIRFLVSLFHRRVEVVGSEHVPAAGPLILVANHHNALVDPMILLATIPRRLVPIAKAPLFRHPLIGPFLHLIGAVPVHRRQESSDDPARNEAMFRATTAALGDGGAILIFPEGVSHEHPHLMPLRTGAARILLTAETATGRELRTILLPVGLVFQEPGTFRAGRVLVLVGKPVPTADCVALHRTAPEQAVLLLTERVTDALRQQIVEADDQHTLGLLRVLETVWQDERSGSPADATSRVAWMQEVMRAYRYLLRREPERVARVRAQLESYARDLELAGLTSRQLSRSYPPGVVLRYALREASSLVLSLPLALWGVVAHAVPYQLTAAAARALRRTPDEEATDKLAAAIVLYPICWLAEGWLAWKLGGGSGLGLFAALLLPAGFFALAWQERLHRMSGEARGFFRFLVDRDLHRHLLARRRALADDLSALARLVPGSELRR